MASNFLLTPTILLLFISPISAQSCQTKEQFTTHCTGQLHGVADGASCFYAPVGGTGIQANALCNPHGGFLAQIHTDSELTKISNFAAALWPPGGFLWIGLQRDDSIPTTEWCSYTQNTTFWYDNGVKNPKLTVSNTWLRTQTCINQRDTTGGRNCFLIYDPNTDQYNRIGPHIMCENSAVILCQYRAPIQNYTLTSAACLAEMPIETLTATEPQQCADTCSQRIWCRSFNFGISNNDPSTGICQLFSWSVHDACAATCQKTFGAGDSPFSACYRYNYVP